MTPAPSSQKAQVIHLEKSIRAPVRKCFSAFGSTRTLARWYDSEAVLSRFKVNGEVQANYFPSRPGQAETAVQEVCQGVIVPELKVTCLADGSSAFELNVGAALRAATVVRARITHELQT